jgi:hypothetical protein
LMLISQYHQLANAAGKKKSKRLKRSSAFDY